MTENRLVKAREAQVTGEGKFTADAAGAAADCGNADHGSARQAHGEIDPRRAAGRAWLLRRIGRASNIEVRDEEIGIGAIEYDHRGGLSKVRRQ